MKYWYLKGGDAIGPLEVSQIAKDDAFSEDSLVCPENDGEKEDAWKSSRDYASDFAPFLRKETAAEQKEHAEYPEPEKQKEAAKRPEPVEYHEPAEHKENTTTFTSIEEIPPEETIHARSPLAPLEDNLLDDLPASSPLAAEEKKEKDTAANKTEQIVSDGFQNAQSEGEYKIQQAAAETFTGGDAIILKSGDSVPSSITSGAAEKSRDNAFTANAKSDIETQSLKNQPNGLQAIENVFAKHTLNPDHSARNPDNVSIPQGPPSDDILFTTNGKILKSISSEEEEDVVPAGKNENMFILIAVSILAILAAIIIALFYKNSTHQATSAQRDGQQPEQTQQSSYKPAIQGIDEGIPSPSVKQNSGQNQTTVPIKTPTLTQQGGDIIIQTNTEADKVKSLNLVKRYSLDEMRGTIDEYLTNKYEGYRTKWESNKFFKDIYKVEFQASRIRENPIIYQFRVDIKTGRIEGFNVDAMDLLK
ncbi:MAG: hypothetical protein LBG46_05915 [Elusimicrobiota bacterium]|jgi:type II secretory pathway pseudopilin PulG|nr:hypothetical protein [Elusimicrobiota bacterium]